MAAPGWRIVESRGRRGLEGLEADWRRIYAQLPLRTSFLSYEACLAHVDHFMREPHRLRCLALTDGRQVRGICLLTPSESGVIDVVDKSRRLLRLPPHHPSPHGKRGGLAALMELRGTWQTLWQWHSRQADVLCADDEARREMIPAVVAHVRKAPEGRPLLVVGPAPADSALWSGLRRLRRRGYHLEPRERVNALDCGRSFEEVRASMSSRFRRELGRRRRKLAELDDVHFRTNDASNGLHDALQTFLQVEASGWKGERGTRSAILCDEAKLAFIRDLATGLRGDTDSCEIMSLHAEGRCIASSFSTRTGGTYSALKTGHDEAYRRVAPGHLLMAKMVERCCEDPAVERLDLVSDATWVGGWCPELVPLQMAYVVVAERPAYPVVAALLQVRFGPARRIARRLRDLRETRAVRHSSEVHGAV